jgi:hypothetical protein
MPRLTRLLASGVVSAALTAGVAAGGLAATTGTANAATTTAVASAAGADATYTCTGGLLGTLTGAPTFELPASFSLPGLPSELPIGIPVQAQPLVAAITLPRNALVTLGIVLGTALQTTVTGLTVQLAGNPVTAQLGTATTSVVSSLGDILVNLDGTLPAFTPDATGSYSVSLPQSFGLGVTGLLGSLLGSTCTLKPGTSSTPVATYTVVKKSSSVAAKAKKTTIKKGKNAKVTVTVATPGTTTLGTVSAIENGQTVATQQLFGGAATFVFKKLKKGVHTLRFVYSGSNFASGSEQSVTLKVKKAAKKKHHAKKPAKH